MNYAVRNTETMPPPSSASIQSALEELAAAKQIRILYGCESGSRAWGMASPDSDYDVRFVYVRSLEWYLSFRQRKDTIDRPVENLLDLAGWDLQKMLSHYYKSNAVVFEWLQSPEVYLENGHLHATLWDWRQAYFSPKTAVHHYLGLAKKMLYSAAENKNVKLKRLFYIIRPILAVRWIIERDAIPPVRLSELEQLLDEMPAVREQVAELLVQKKKGLESTRAEFPSGLQNFLHTEIQRCETIARRLPTRRGDPERLDELFRKEVMKGT